MIAKVGIIAETEGGGVVVVDKKDHVGLVRLHPFLGGSHPRKRGLPVVLLGPAEVEGGATAGMCEV